MSCLIPISQVADAAQKVLDIQAGRAPRPILSAQDAAARSAALAAVRRSPVSQKAAWQTAPPEREVPARPADLSELDAGKCAALRVLLITLLNNPGVTYQQKQTGLDNLYAHYYDLAWLTTKERNLRAKLAAPDDAKGAAGHTLCPECAAPVGYNPDTCGACYRTASQLAA